MTVPWYYTFFIIMVIVLSAIIMGKQYDYKSKNKNVELLLDLFLYFVSGVSFSFVLFDGYVNWLTLIGSLLIGVIVSFMLAAVLNRDTKLYDDAAQYTMDDLIGKVGIIKQVYSGSFKNGFDTLGELQDDASTNIRLLVFNNTINEGDIFEITEIKDGKILAKIIKSKYE